VVRHFTKIVKDAKPKLTPTTKLYLVIADAVSMYTNMIKEEVIKSIEKLLKESFMEVDANFQTEDLLKTIEIILENNVFQFNDTYWKQLKGTAMGTPAACVLATFYFTHHELFTLLPMFAKWILAYIRYLDDTLILWVVDSEDSSSMEAFEKFKEVINLLCNLDWEVSDLLHEVNFLDLTINITDNNDIIFSPYGKPFHLYRYIPPNSAHPPGLLQAMIHSILLSYYEHSTHQETFKTNTSLFFNRLVECSYKPKILKEQFMISAEKIQYKEKMYQRSLTNQRRDYNHDGQRISIPSPETLLLFADHISNGASYLFPCYQPLFLPILEMLYCMIYDRHKPPPPQSSPPNTLFFHYLYHPRDISCLTIHRLYDEFLSGVIKQHTSVDRFVVCYHRDTNLKEYLSLSAYKAPSEEEKVSNYFKRFAAAAEKEDDKGVSHD